MSVDKYKRETILNTSLEAQLHQKDAWTMTGVMEKDLITKVLQQALPPWISVPYAPPRNVKSTPP